MWQILGVLVFCGLLSPSVGTVPGIKVVLNLEHFIQETLTNNGLLENLMKDLPFSDIPLGALGLLGKITGLKIVKVRITGAVVAFTDEKIKINLSVDLDIAGNAVLPLSSTITITAHMDITLAFKFENFSDGKFDIVDFECAIIVGAIDIKLLGGLIPLQFIPTIQQSITQDLTKQACGILKVAIDAVNNILLDSLNAVLPFGIFGNLNLKLAALPTITNEHIVLDIYVSLDIAALGISITIPETAEPMALPSLDSYLLCFAIHEAVFNIILSVVIPKAPLELSNLPAAFSGADALKNAILGLIPPGVLPDLATSDLSLKITIGEDPLIDFDTTGAVVTVTADIEILAKKADGSKVSVFVVKCKISLKATISLVDGKLKLGLSILNTEFALKSSIVGIIDISDLLTPLNLLLNEVFLPVLNAPFASGIPLPAIPGIPLLNPTIKTVKNALLVCI